MKSIPNTLIFLSFILFICFQSIGQICYHTVANGLWSSPATWAATGVPPISLPATDTIRINHTINYDVNQEVLGLMIIALSGSITGANTLFIGLGGVNSGELINYGSILIDELRCEPDDCLIPYAPVDPFPVVNNYGLITATNKIDIGQDCGSGSLYNFPGGQIITDELQIDGYLCNQDSIFALSEVEVQGGTVDCCGYIETPSLELEQNGAPDRPANLMCQHFCTSAGGMPNTEIDGLMISPPTIYTNPIPSQGLVDTLTTFCMTVLPVELLSFEAQILTRNRVDLDWLTATESNNDFFTIERSLDGRNWELVGNVDGAGSSQQALSYSLIDHNPYIGVSYYRLIQTDFNGSRRLYKIRSVDNTNLGHEFTAYPNPSTIHMYVQGEVKDIESITIHSLMGQDLTSFIHKEMINKRKVMLDVSALPNGVYYLRGCATSPNLLNNRFFRILYNEMQFDYTEFYFFLITIQFRCLILSTFTVMNEIKQLKKKVIKQAAAWALFMFVFMEFISKALIYKEPITLKNVLISIPIWIIAGCIFGLIVFYFEKKKIKNK